MTDTERLKALIEDSDNIVFFGGAGVSTESGIKDFRSKDGIYNMKFKYPPETMLSHSFFFSHTEDFFDFYRKMMMCDGIEPNKAHYALAELEKRGKLKAVITQNIDGLHQATGNKRVYELHGSVKRNFCEKCKKSFSYEFVRYASGVPYCECGGIVKPDVVLYEEPLDDATVYGAINAIAEADLIIVAGTSLTVYPAASFLNYFKGRHIVLINRDATPFDSRADLIIRGPVGKTLGEAVGI